MKSQKVSVNGASIELIHGDSLEVLNPSCPTIERGSVDCVVTSPPYNLGIKYRSHDDKQPRAVYLDWTKRWLEAVRWVMSENGSLFLNVGGKPTDPHVPFEVYAVARDVFKVQNTIAWVKAVSVDGAPVKGHVKPINSKRFLNGSWELLLHLTKTGEVELDRTAPGLGVEFADKSNLTRGTRGKNGDRRCRGDVWQIPYETIQSREDDRPHPACVDAETECLTIDGWRRHEDLKPGVVAAQFDMETGKLSWAPIEEISRFDVENETLVSMEMRGASLLFTKNHRTIIKTRSAASQRMKSRLTPFKIIRADEVKKHHAIPIAAEWESAVGAEPVSPEWAELFGWYVAEGCETGAQWAVEIYQSIAVNNDKVQRIESLLKSVGAEFTKAVAPRTWKGRDATMAAFQIRGFAATFFRQWCPGKMLPKDVLTWSKPLLGRIFSGLIDGDGHEREDGRKQFVQKNKETADLTQAIGVRLGMSTKLSRRSSGTRDVYFNNRKIAWLRGTGGRGEGLGTQQYTGTVWCPKLPKGTWVARRSGRSFMTGNTFPPRLAEMAFLLHGVSRIKKTIDPFSGLGSTARASAKLGLDHVGIEVDEIDWKKSVERVKSVT